MKPFAILIPAYQPDQALLDLVRQIQAHALLKQGYLLLVNDGSSPDKERIFQDLTDQGIPVLHHPQNQGKGAALKTGISYIADKEPHIQGIVTMDADGQHAVKDVAACLEAWDQASEDHTMVLGVRQFGQGTPLRSLVGNLLTRKLLEWFRGISLQDTQTGLRILPRSAFDDMLALSGSHYEWEMEVLLASKDWGLNLVQVPIETLYFADNAGSHFNPLVDSFRVYKQFLTFIAVSLLSFLVDLGAFSLFLALFASWAIKIYLASFLARILSAFVNYQLNRHWVFGQGHKQSAWAYLGLSLTIVVLSASLIQLFHVLLPSWDLRGLKILVDMGLFLLSYFVQKHWVFKGRGKHHG